MKVFLAKKYIYLYVYTLFRDEPATAYLIFKSTQRVLRNENFCFKLKIGGNFLRKCNRFICCGSLLSFSIEKGQSTIKKVLWQVPTSYFDQSVILFMLSWETAYLILRPISYFPHVLMISWESKKLSLECQNFSLSHDIFKIISNEIMRNSDILMRISHFLISPMRTWEKEVIGKNM